jgi:hypothetical protein
MRRPISIAIVIASCSISASAQPVQLVGARSLLDGVYSAYTRGEDPGILHLFTAELNAAIAAQSDSEGGGLSYDPFCQCQDFGDFRYAIKSLEPTPDGAIAQVDFSSFGQSRSVRIKLVHREGEWQVADIDNGESSLLNGG